MQLPNKIQLITYPDSLGGNLQQLNETLDKHFKDCFGGVHILPPFPSTGDRGFAPTTYLKIEPEFGTWMDIEDIAERFCVCLDVMVNHVSSQSDYFKDFMEKGKESIYADCFYTFDKFWPDGKLNQNDVDQVFLRRPKPYSTYKVAGQDTEVWTTFGNTDPSEQIDLDVNSPQVHKIFEQIFATFSKYKIQMIRLDAVAFVTKRMRTSCFFVEPEIDQFLEWITKLADRYNIALLPEVHAPLEIQKKLTDKGFWTYDFVLPYLILETLFSRSADKLAEYLTDRSHKLFTMLDCHDGVPVKPDVDGLVDSKDARKVVDVCVERGSKLSRVLSKSHQSPDGFDVHQICGTYYSMLGCDDDAYYAARALQLFVPGIPQVYYVGALAGVNDMEREAEVGDIRELNRHNYEIDEIEAAMTTPIVQRLKKLFQLRNNHHAFNGEFSFDCPEPHLLSLAWHHAEEYCCLDVNLQANKTTITYSENGVDKSL